MDHINNLAHGIETGRPKKRFFLEKIGSHCLFAVDETKRLFALLSAQMVGKHIRRDISLT
jgi:hypothetical protein